MTEDQKRYQVEKTKPTPYLNELDEVISGFSIRVRIFEFDELQDFKVPDLKKETVEKVIEDFIKEREAIRDLG